MKSTLSLLFCAFVLLASCTKDKSSATEVTDANKVNINGTAYPIVKIKNQTWVAVNYNGPGGKNYDDSDINDPAYGKLYTLAEADAIKLPAGWRMPTSYDYDELFAKESPKGENFLSLTGWNDKVGTNLTGFNAYPSGCVSKSYTLGKYGFRGAEAVFITSTVKVFGSSPAERACFVFNTGPTGGSAFNSDYIKEPTDRGALRFIKAE